MNPDEQYLVRCVCYLMDLDIPVPLTLQARLDEAGLKVPGANWTKPREA